MKKYLISVLCLILVTLTLVFSSQHDEKQESVIVTSFYPVYIAALNVTTGVDGITIKNLTNEVGGCVHDYTLTPQDMVKLSDAKALVINGSGMESFMSDVIQNYPNMQIIDLSVGINQLEAHHEHEHSVDDMLHSQHINSHTFVSIENHIIQIKNLATALANLDLESAEVYMQNADNYIKKLEQLKEKIQANLQSYKGEKIIALHESFAYFASEFGLDLVDVIEIEEGQTLPAQKVADITDSINEKGVNIIALEQNYESSMASSIAKDTGATTFVFDPVVLRRI